MDESRQKINFLFETSWEVCNKVGGIYTVLSSKAKTLKKAFNDNLIFIGPDVWTEQNPSPYFAESPRLMRKWAQQALLPEGVDVRVGRWEIPGRPVAILVKFDGMYATKDQAYGRMWELFGVDSLHAYGDYDEGCAFARAAAVVIQSIVEYSGVDPSTVIAHFDEWTTAMGLLAVKADMPRVATIFTTHATSIGRSICGNGKPLYGQLRNYNGDQMARELNMEAKHSLEKAAAQQADCFTTVSDVTATEATQLLDKAPDIVTPNGFELNFVPGKTRYAAARKAARASLLGVASALTGIEFSDDTFIVATSGRCEYRNKGLDLFLDAVKTLEREKLPRKTLAFVLVPAWCKSARTDLQHALAMGEHSRLSDPRLTHTLYNYNEDPINCRIHQLAFNNDGSSNVTVIYVPCYLDGHDGIFNKHYYDLLPGIDASVFASYYEPWGYTPLESIAFAVPTVTTTLAGFGCWISENWPNADFDNSGVKVVNRTDTNYIEAKEEITAAMARLVVMPKPEIAQCRTAAAQTAAKAQWEDFISFYEQAYYIAFDHRNARVAK